MTAQPAASPLPTATLRPVSLYEGPQGELYLRLDDVAYPVHGNWTQRLAALNGTGSLFALDAEAWSRNTVPRDPAAKRLALALDAPRTIGNPPPPYRRIATWNPGGRIDLHHSLNRVGKGAIAYLGDALPAVRAARQNPVESTAAVPKRTPATPDEATPYDGFPKGFQRQPEVEVRVAFDVLLGLYRDQNTTVLGEGSWMLAATDAAGRFLSSWGKGTGNVPDVVWTLAAEAAHRHHLEKHGSL